MRRATLGPSLLILLAALPALGQDLDDRHLSILPTDADTRAALVASLLPLADPDRLAAAEALPGGTATVPFTAKDDAVSQPSAGRT